MSRYEWEHGTITLPSAETAAVRAAVRTAVNAHRDAVEALAKSFWVDVARRTRSAKVFAQRLDDWNPNADSCVVDDARVVLDGLRRAPRTPRRADIDAVCSAMNTRSHRYANGWFSITFEGRRVTWDVGENNHAIARAHAHPVAVAFFAALGRVRWTRGTGGVLAANDEFNSEAQGPGEGSNYVTAKFPPPPSAPRRTVLAGRW